MNQIIEISPGSINKVLSGDKVLTIQKGRRLYNLGDAILLDPEDKSQVDVEVLRVSYCKVKNAPIVDLAIHGDKRWESLLEYLKQYYPKISNESTITIIRYKLSKNRNNKGASL